MKNLSSILIFFLIFFCTSIIAAETELLKPPPIEEKIVTEEVTKDVSDVSGFDDKEIQELLTKLNPLKLDDQSIKEVAAQQGIVVSPEFIRALRETLLRRDVALNQGMREPELKVHAQRVELSSTQAPIRVQVLEGYDTFIEFYDIAGNPWPAEDKPSVGNSSAFKAERLNDTEKKAGDAEISDDESNIKSHIIRVTAEGVSGDSTLTVHLKGIKESINFRLVNNALVDFTDYKRVITLPLVNSVIASKRFAKGRSIDNNEAVMAFRKLSNESFDDFLTMDPREGSISLPVLDGEGHAWLYDGFMYVRSRNKVLHYPDALGVQSLDGWYVHKLKPYPLITYSVNSKNTTFTIDDERLMESIRFQKIQAQQVENNGKNIGAGQ